MRYPDNNNARALVRLLGAEGEEQDSGARSRRVVRDRAVLACNDGVHCALQRARQLDGLVTVNRQEGGREAAEHRKEPAAAVEVEGYGRARSVRRLHDRERRERLDGKSRVRGRARRDERRCEGVDLVEVKRSVLRSGPTLLLVDRRTHPGRMTRLCGEDAPGRREVVLRSA